MVAHSDRRGFTLIELLIVTVVVASLMAIVFRLTGIAGSASSQERTVERLQKLENCLSGYFATFGSYPPVPLQGASRNIYRKVTDEHPMIQTDDPTEVDDSDSEFNKYYAVDAACRAQPVAAMYPPAKRINATVNGRWREVSSKEAYESFKEAVNAYYEADGYSDEEKQKIDRWRNATFQDIGGSPGFLNNYQGETDYTRLQLFRFGLMSFLLPRYRFMLQCAKGNKSGDSGSFNNSLDKYRQWTDYNPLPPRMDTGIAYESWKAFCDTMGGEDDWQIDLIPSQAACARWMPNLKDVVSGPNSSFFGVNISADNGSNGIPLPRNAAGFTLYSAGGRNSSSSSGYPLMSLTVVDGWGREFYYYSPAPYQTYVLWSAGRNGRTFPPWIDIDQFRKDHGEQCKTAIQWMSDDIKFMSTGK